MDFSSTKTAAKYCRRCGSLLPKSNAQRQKQIAEMYAAYGESIKFCNECGMPLFPDGTPYNGYSGQPKRQKSETKRKQAYESYNSPRRKRETVYEGVLHRCPNCGELIDAFVAFCPGCGYEIRDTKSATAVSEFATKLEKINAREMPVFVESRSVLKTIFGRDFQEDDEAEEAFERFKSQKEQEIASFIINFSVPNTKEDVTEFIMLAAFNIDFKHGIDDIITTAWISKLNQCS